MAIYRYVRQKFKGPARPNSSLNPILDYIGNPKIQVTFDGSCLKEEKLILLTLSKFLHCL